MKFQNDYEKTLWDQPYNDIDARAGEYYLGGRFYPKGQPKETWVMTGNFLDLIPDPNASPAPIQQLLIQ